MVIDFEKRQASWQSGWVGGGAVKFNAEKCEVLHVDRQNEKRQYEPDG